MISRRALNLKPSPTLALAARAAALKAEGKDVISLSLGEPDWDTFPAVKKAAVVAIENGFTKYSPANGLPDLRQSISKKVNQELGTTFRPDQVTVSTGGKFVLYSALQALIDPGDEVLIPAPYWVSYPTMVELAEGHPVIAPWGEGFKITPEILQKHLSKKTKLVIFNSPSNPTGAVYSIEEWTALASVLRDWPSVTILMDDIYNRLVFSPEGVAPHLLKVAPDLTPRTLVVNGASKTYSMTGWRIGWALGPDDIIKAMTNIQSQSVSCAATFTQMATRHALEESEPDLKQVVRELRSRRDFVLEELRGVPSLEVAIPEGAFYVFPNLGGLLGKTHRGHKIQSCKDFSERLLVEKLVAVVPGLEFGAPGFVRLSYVLSTPKIRTAIQRIREFTAEMK